MIYSIHVLRGLCAWMVVLHHFAYSYYLTIPNALPDGLKTFTFTLGIGVDVFFIISGYVMSLMLEKHESKPIRALSFLKRRIFRIFPGWLFYLLLFSISTTLLIDTPYRIIWDWSTLLKSAFLIPHSNLNGSGAYPILYVGWSLMYEMFFYFLIFILLTFRIKNIKAILSILLFSLAMTLPQENILKHSNFFFMEFLIGFLYRERPAYVGALILWSCFSIFNIYSAIEGVRFMLSCSIFTLFLNIKLDEKSILTKLLKTSGDISYSIYLSHLIGIGIIYIVYPPQLGVIHGVTALFMTVGITYLMSYLTFHYIEKKATLSK